MWKAAHHEQARRVWAAAYGPIPPKHDIHHRDEDWTNNAIENLLCVSRSLHQRQHIAAWVAARPDKTCPVCQRTFRDRTGGGRAGKQRYCSANCKQTVRRRSKVDHETRVCQRCGADFRCNRYFSTRCCSLSCAAYQRAAARALGAC